MKVHQFRYYGCTNKYGNPTGVRKLKPVAEKFYATLNDEQKAHASLYVDWPGLSPSA